MNDEILKKMGFGKEVQRVRDGNCPLCNKKIVLDDFENELSLKEFVILGMCQDCQNRTFGEDDE